MRDDGLRTLTVFFCVVAATNFLAGWFVSASFPAVDTQNATADSYVFNVYNSTEYLSFCGFTVCDAAGKCLSPRIYNFTTEERFNRVTSGLSETGFITECQAIEALCKRNDPLINGNNTFTSIPCRWIVDGSQAGCVCRPWGWDI